MTNSRVGMPSERNSVFSASRSCAAATAAGGGNTSIRPRSDSSAATRRSRFRASRRRRVRASLASAAGSSSCAQHDGRDLRAGSVAARIEQRAIDAERVAREREHAAELAGADDANSGSRHGRSGASGGAQRAVARIGLLEHLGRLLGSILIERRGNRGILVGEDRGREQRRVDGAATCRWRPSRRGCRAASARSTAVSRCLAARAIEPARR